MSIQSTNTSPASDLERLDRADVIHGFSALRAQATKDVLIMDSAQGMTVRDQLGREFLDAGAGLWCMNVGYGRQSIADAAAAQMQKMCYFHSFSNFSNEPMVRLSERLLRLAPGNMARVVYANSGSEANDTQIKLVRRYNNILGRTKKKTIIARMSSYHGSTVAAGSLTGLEMVHRTFDLPIPGIRHTLAPDYHRRPAGIDSPEAFSRYLADALNTLIEAEGPDTVAAFIAEPITGAGGVLMPPTGYFREIQKVLKHHDVLMIADEVITGFGRTGRWFASTDLGIEPDLVSVAKGLTSGYFPMSACLISPKVADVLYSDKSEDGMFAHGFTYSGHPVAAAVAHANLDILEQEDLPGNAAKVGDYLISKLRQRLGQHPLVGEIRGKGLLIGIELDADRASRRPFDNPHHAAGLLSRSCLEERLLVRGGHGRVVAALAPPLIATARDADEIAARLERAIERVARGLTASGAH